VKLVGFLVNSERVQKKTRRSGFRVFKLSRSLMVRSFKGSHQTSRVAVVAVFAGFPAVLKIEASGVELITFLL
jgi:hypothetical protein